jgi:hypothetical protein
MVHRKMTAYEIAKELDERYGNPLGPKQYDIIKSAIVMLRMQADEITALQSDVTELVKVK